jgi:eukaryotic-like serine/threonine-protein kinase
MFETGQEIAARFVLTRRFGGGESAQVWQALDRSSDSPVALKMQVGADAGLEEQFNTLRKLDHPGILRPREFIRAGDCACLVMDLAEPGDLASLRGRSWREFLPQLRCVAQALAYLHERGLVHGDVKASNVVLDGARGARLIDFACLRNIGAARASTDPVSPFTASPQQRAAQSAQPGDDIYSFGALLGELLTGQPPGYAATTAATEAAALIPVQPAPAALIALARRCLRESAGDRPVSMRGIDAELGDIEADAAVAARAAPMLTPPPTAADRLRPSWERAATGPAPDAAQLQRQGFRSGIVVAAAVVLGLAAIAMFVVPAYRAPAPKVVGTAPSTTANGKPAREVTAEPTPEPEPDLAALAAEKSTADELRTGIVTRLGALRDADSATWAAAGTAAAVAALAGADELMRKRQYSAAQSRFKALAHELSLLETQRNQAMQSALQRGQAALDHGDAQQAAAAFAQALRIDPKDAAAVRGARRAASLDAVTAQLARAREFEQQGRTAQAAAAYRQALALDADSPEAQRGAARTGGELQADQFGRAMARVYAAMDARHEVEARAALEEAHRLKPDDPAIARAQAQLAANAAADQLAGALAQARAAAAAEHWQEALAQYQRALALDGTLVDVRQAMGVAGERARLDQELEQLIAHPERAYSDSVYAAAQATLQRAQSVPAPGPVLSRQIGRVTELLGQAATPVNVVLRSDSLTAVTVYRVGALGNFAERTLQLKPGRYVVVGTRVGYRDVRRELNVVPGSAAPVVVVQCVEPI